MRDALSRNRWLVIFALFLAVSLLLGARNEINTNRIEHNTIDIERARALARYDSCLGSVAVLTKFNKAQIALARIDRQSIAADPQDKLGVNDIRRSRVYIYKHSLQPLPDCDLLKP